MATEQPGVLYDHIGRGYAATRRPDARIAEVLARALGDARRVVNVGAGAGAYEPAGRDVLAVEPSAEMIRQRAPGAAPCVQARAEALPFADGAFDAALAVLTLHHWSDWRRGVGELRRVARRAVVLTWDPDFAQAHWLSARYLPEVAALDAARFPSVAALAAALGGASIEPVPIPHDCTDGFYGAFWRRPAAYLDPDVRRGISCLQQVPAARVARALAALAEDLRTGAWERAFGALLQRDALDLGYRVLRAP
jgi:SAM-dependent methyltransferase